MSNWIKNARIQNFKSLRDVSLECEQINVLVGKPNVGKSNLLEALSLLGLTYNEAMATGFSSLVRFERLADFFYDQNFFDNPIEISTNNIGNVNLRYENQEFKFSSQTIADGDIKLTISPEGKPIIDSSTPYLTYLINNPILKFYKFPEKQFFQSDDPIPYLKSPFGENFLMTLQTNKELRQEASSIFEQYGLEVLIDAQGDQIDIVKRRDGILYKIPFSLVADTLRRYLFYLAAIKSNRDSILLFEEPESHNYPPYIKRLAHRIIEDKTNQFFITTHSPFLFNTLVEEAENIAVFLVEYEDFQTKIRRLTDENLREIMDYGLNIFTEQEMFV